MLDRDLSVFAGGEPVTGFRRARLTGREALGLLPRPYFLDLWNPEEEDFLRLSRAKEITVLHGGSLLASGALSAVYRRAVPEGMLARAVFSPGLPLWEARVSLSVEAGATVSETVRRLLEASGTGISLLSFPGNDPAFSRGQAFYGRAAECVEEALSVVPARACLAASGLCVVPPSGLPVTLRLSEEDLTDAPSFLPDGQMVLRTRLRGWPVGKGLSVQYGNTYAEGLVVERFVEADTLDGPWACELLCEVSS